MLSSDIRDWLSRNTSPGYRAHVSANQAETERLLVSLGVAGTELAELYLHYGPSSVRGWYELIELEEIREITAYAEAELGVPAGYLALTSIEGQGITLYERATGRVFDVEFGQFDSFSGGSLPPLASSFGEFLRWCRARANAA